MQSENAKPETTISIINLRAELNNLRGLHGRTPTTPEAQLEGRAFGKTFPYRDGFISTVRYSGKSAWERHPDEEILIVTAGTGFLFVADGSRISPRSLSEHLLVIVPPNRWHQIESEDGITMITITPQPSEHVHTDDPPA